MSGVGSRIPRDRKMNQWALPFSYYLLPITYYLLPITYYLSYSLFSNLKSSMNREVFSWAFESQPIHSSSLKCGLHLNGPRVMVLPPWGVTSIVQV
jgi:hypothetical protein